MPLIPATRMAKDDPRFPHGTYKGSRAGCDGAHCNQACLAAKRKYNADAARHRRKNPGVHRNQVPVADAVKLLTDLQDAVPGASRNTLASATGLTGASIGKILDGKQVHVTRNVYEAIRRTTPAMVRRDLTFVPAKKARQLYGSLRAQGWEGTWIAKELGQTWTSGVSFIAFHSECVTIETDAKMREIAARVGDAEGSSNRSRYAARRSGWLPLKRYDEHGDLLPDLDAEEAERVAAGLLENPDGERTKNDGAALRRLCSLRSVLLDGMPPTPATELHQTSLTSDHWDALHVRFKGTHPNGHAPSVLLPSTEAEKPFVALIREYVEAIPVSDVALILGAWSAIDVPLTYDARAAERALFADLHVLAAGEDPRTGEPVVLPRDGDAVPVRTPATVTKLRPQENVTPWRLEPAVIPKTA